MIPLTPSQGRTALNYLLHPEVQVCSRHCRCLWPGACSCGSAGTVASLTSLCPPEQTQDHAVLEFWGLGWEVMDLG